MRTVKCSTCGGDVVDGKQKYSHWERCAGYTQEGIDHLVCRECGYKSPVLSLHIRVHGMSEPDYHLKYPDDHLVLDRIVRRRLDAILSKGGYKPISEKRGAMQCAVCSEWYQPETAVAHREKCVSAHPDKYELNKDYVRCPECQRVLLSLGKHLRKEHQWDKDKVAIEVGRGLRLMASNVVEQRARATDFNAAQAKRESTHLARHGFANPFSNPAVQKKTTETNQRRYGTGHPMQNEEVFIRQTESAQRGPSEQERFFDGHTCPNVVYVGYGGRFIRTKTGVHKYGRLIKDLNPDFIVLPDNVLESALSASKDGRKLSSEKHRSKYVVELLGDYYHSEAVIGVLPEEHEREMVEAYKSAGIECLVLWEKDVMSRWESIRPMVDAWVEKAVRGMNESPIYSRTKSKVDRRKGDLVCPYGSGRRFKSHKMLAKWLASPLNYWRPGLVEGRDFVVCLECGARCRKVTEHVRKSHGMTKEGYLERHLGAATVAGEEK